ncbi:YfbK domain-containing protein [Glaciecola sp. MF2-115]|uniref:vWA domain-containing protein n=1 Tax=Glaciecola sp. MF2-115 TaxID=3384827 RepID=UPI0039A322AE
MKLIANSIKAAVVAALVIALANCATAPSENEARRDSSAKAANEVKAEAQAQAQRRAKQKSEASEAERISVIASRLKADDDTVLADQNQPLPPRAPEALISDTLKQLLTQVKTNNELLAHSQRDAETGFNNQPFTHNLTQAQKEELYRLVSRHPESVGQIFKRYRVNPTIETEYNAISTFAMDVDNGSFKLASAMLHSNRMPDPAGIRVEEFVNALDYQYQHSDDLFALSAEAMRSPFREGFYLLHVGAQTRELKAGERNPSNIVLVADVSGSMGSDDKIELLQVAMKTLVSQLDKNDRVALVAYSDNAKVLLDPTRASSKRKIYKAIERLRANGSTNVEAGLKTAYRLANEMQEPGFNNRVILTSDGMANTGSRSPEAILSTINDAKQNGIFLTTLGVGKEVYNDYLLEQLANQGNGTYLYIADLDDVQEVFVDNINSQLQTVAKDAKIQVAFDPAIVSHYRLLGYENRHLETQDFMDAEKDGAEIGAGQKVTAIYEIKLAESIRENLPRAKAIASLAVSYKKPEGKKVFQIQKNIPVSIIQQNVEHTSADSLLSFSMAAFAEKLRQSYWARFYTYHEIEGLLLTLPRNYQAHQQVKELKQLISIAERLDNGYDEFEANYPISKVSFERVPLLD